MSRTFVIGAGASCELDFPSGEGLKTAIYELLRSNDEDDFAFADSDMRMVLANYLKHLRPVQRNQQTGSFADAAKAIRRAMLTASSIDNFLQARSDDSNIVFLGKVAIAMAITRAERASKLFRFYNGESPSDASALQGTWHLRLFQFLVENCPRIELLKQFLRDITFVIFNYDRCIEHFLFNEVQTYYGVSSVDAARILNNVDFLHPYGQVGLLPWQGSAGVRSFGDAEAGTNLELVGGLKTFSESVDSHISERIQAAVAGANDLIFLGFGYLPQNMLLLTPQTPSRTKRIFATAYGTAFGEFEALKRNLRSVVGRSGIDPARGVVTGWEPYIADATCRAYLDEHWIRFNSE